MNASNCHSKPNGRNYEKVHDWVIGMAADDDADIETSGKRDAGDMCSTKLRTAADALTAQGLVVEENYVLPDGLPADVQFICGEFWIGIADCQAAQDRQFRRDSQLRADNLGIP